MTRLTALSMLIAVLATCSVTLCEHQYGICNVNGCKCVTAGHPSWIMVNCSIPGTQKLDIFEGDLPEATSDLVVYGAEALMLGANSLTRLKDLRHIRFSGIRLILLRRGAGSNLNVVNAFLDIEQCDVLRVEEKTFSNIRGPLTVNIRDCDYVSVEGNAFSWLLKLSISNVHNLLLSPGSFKLDPSAANVGEHGPGMSIELTNVSAPEFPANTFGSSAAEIAMTGVEVRDIRAGAFSANTYIEIRAINCTIHAIETQAFAQESLINNLLFDGCKIIQMGPKAIQSAVTKLIISNSKIDAVASGAINATVATVRIINSVFHKFLTRGFELSSWNKMYLKGNKFDVLPPYAVVAPTTIVHELVFVDNEIENLGENSLGFIGQTFDSKYAPNVVYEDNYYGIPCHCNVTSWYASVMGSKNGEPYEKGSYCTVNDFFARCFNVPELNMLLHKFIVGVCEDESKIHCETYKSKTEGKPTEIKNPRFPHKKEEDSISDRDKKVIGIVIVTAVVCVIIVIFISFIRWMKRQGYCANIKNILMSSNSSCGSLCNRMCLCGRNTGADNVRSISQLSVNEYSERRRLNEPRRQDIMLETTAGAAYTEDVILMDDKTTQTLPEELTKELLENLKEKLEDPENYVEAREMIEHLYELIKVEESCNSNVPTLVRTEENIYDLPFQNTTPRIGKNKKQMISVGTRAPSLDKLLPLSPYNRQTALAHEYFEPKDFAVHLYAEIANCDKEKRSLLGPIPDIVEQVVPRGPYLRAVREKMSSPTSLPAYSISKSPEISPTSSSFNPVVSPCSIKSIKSFGSNSSAKMVNRPLPDKPAVDAGEGTSSTIQG